MSNVHEGKLLPDGWFVYTTETGKPYFYNRQTFITQWEPPSHTTDSSQNQQEESNTTFLNDKVFTPLNHFDYCATNKESESINPVLHFKSTNSLTDTKNDPFHPLQGEITSMMYPSTLSSNKFDVEANAGIPSKRQSTSLPFWCFHLELLKPYFNVDTDTVVKRAQHVLYLPSIFKAYRVSEITNTPYTTPSSQSEESGYDQFIQHPDFYGSFWIPTTLITFLFVFSHLCTFWGKYHNVHPNYRSLIVAAFMIYGYLLLIPLILWTLNFFLADSLSKGHTSFAQFFTVYGYSFLYGIPTSFLCVLPYETSRWIACLLAFCFSSLFILLPFRGYLRSCPHSLKIIILIVLCLSQCSLYLTFPLYFFS